MKTLAKIILTLSFFMNSSTSFAARICDDFITDEWPDYRYDINTADAVVIDKKTTLMWKRCSEGLTGNNCENGVATLHNWQQALLLQDAANAENFAGFNDWRLPNIEELRSIVALNCANPAINEVAFPNTPVYWFWSSSPILQNDNFAWDIYFGKGNDTGNFRTVEFNVRLVRDSQ